MRFEHSGGTERLGAKWMRQFRNIGDDGARHVANGSDGKLWALRSPLHHDAVHTMRPPMSVPGNRSVFDHGVSKPSPQHTCPFCAGRWSICLFSTAGLWLCNLPAPSSVSQHGPSIRRSQRHPSQAPSEEVPLGETSAACRLHR